MGVNIFIRIQRKIKWGINALAGKAARLFYRPKKPAAPLADRLLSDALRLAEIPSPTRREEQRIAFILERLTALGLMFRIDENGNILVRFHSTEIADEPPLLLFTDLGSKRWHPLESLSRLDAVYASGAGLGDVLGAAALLSVAENIAAGRILCRRELLLLFAARSFDDPETDVFYSVTEIPMNRPCAAIGVWAFSLGSVRAHTRGTYRITISFSRNLKKESGAQAETAPDAVNGVVEALLAAAGDLSRIAGDAPVRVFIRRLEAGTGFGHTPSEGLLEIELESSDAALLDEAKNQAAAAAAAAGAGKALKITLDITSFIPVGDPGVNAALLEEVREVMKELKIKINEENGSDPSAFLSNLGIPALSLGMINGQEGLLKDEIEIASIEKGRMLLEKIISRFGGEKP
ncbi:MAG: hypothetical protein LBL19_08080 [Spirochaetaceae bacterium]|jgi:hypothetical protein|nr:hypothetical protein [Spirochaetaceae bacterium]